MSLKEIAFKGIKWTAISTITGAVIQLLQLIILTHYLSPTDFGLLALTWVVISFSQMFIDFGVSNAIIYEQNISRQQLDTLYWLNISSGFTVYLILFFSAPLISNFYEESRLTVIIRWLSLSFLIQPFEQQFIILLKKALLFNQIAKREIFSKIVSLVIAVILAVYGFGIFALVYAQLFAIFISTILMIYIGLKFHRPSFYFKFSLIKHFFKFGLYQMGESFLNYFNSQFDTIIIGKILGVEAVGIYNIAKSLAMRPAQIINPIITQISFPLMSKLQNNLPQLKNIYLKTTHTLSTLNFPVYTFIAAFAEPIIKIFLGDKWQGAIPVLRILAMYGMVRSTVNPVGVLMLSVGKPQLGFYWNLVLFFLIPAAIYTGTFYGLNGTAFTLLGLQIILLIPAWNFLIKKCCHAGLSEYFREMLIPFIISLVQAIVYLIIILFITDINFQLIAGIIILGISIFWLNKTFNRDQYLLFRQFLYSGKC